MSHPPRLERLDAVRSRFPNPHHVPVTVFAREDVPIQGEGLDQLEEFLGLQGTLTDIYDQERRGRVAPFWGDSPGRIDSVVVTPEAEQSGRWDPRGSGGRCPWLRDPSRHWQ